MSCGSISGPTEQHLISVVTANQFAAFTPWMATIGLDVVRAVYNVRALTGTFQYQLAIQTAVARTDNPDAWALLDSLRTTSGEICTGDVTLSLGGKWYLRLGVMYNESTAPGTSQADVGLTLTYNACGKVVGGGSFQLAATDAGPYFQIVSGWIPASMAGKHRAAFIASQTGANLRFKIAYQTATTNINTPSTWTTADADHYGDGELCTNDLPTTGVTTVMWIRFAIQYWSTSGTSMGNVTVAVAARV
jgi:hypothetical protein